MFWLAEDQHLVVRVSWVFGPDRPSFIDAMIKRGAVKRSTSICRRQIFHAPLTRTTIAEMVSRFFDVDVPAAFAFLPTTGECSWQNTPSMRSIVAAPSGISLKAKRLDQRRLLT